MTVPASSPSTFSRRLLLACAAGVLVATAIAMALPYSDRVLAEIYFFRQDLPVLIGLAAVLIGLGIVPDGADWRLGARAARRVTLAIAVLVALIAFVGRRIVFDGLSLSRDEAMVAFDAQIFRSGALLARVPEVWRDFVPALQPDFLFKVANHEAWFSAYLPGNAALHALLGPAAGPLLAAAAIGLAAACARRLWPGREDAALMAALLVAASPQVLITAMTTYAATAHLTLNLLWLWLFLRGGKASHGAALLTGFVAVGLHQIVFHPLFVAPFIVMLWLQRRWALASVYTVGYGAICLAWLLYWPLLLAAHGLAPDVQDFSDLLSRLQQLLNDFTWGGLTLMLKNLLRFWSWTVPMLLPMAVVAVCTGRRWRAEFWALAAGLGLTTLVVFILLPYQGHGWGYRYWHGLIGNVALLAVAGFVARPAVMPKLVASIVVAGLVLLPWRAFQVHFFAEPYASADRMISAMPQPFVLIDGPGVLSAADLVRNDPFLQDRPLRFDAHHLDDARLRRLCAMGPVGYFGPEQAQALGMPLQTAPPALQAQFMERRALLKTINCAQ